MFIHRELYSQLAGPWRGKTFYGIAERIKRQMQIPDDASRTVAKTFDPSGFDAAAAKAAGMKRIIVTAKHHEGFALFKSATPDKFNIVDATPFARDPMRELAEACRKAGLGFGFYYSHHQDRLAPGGAGGPAKNPDGSPATFDGYFKDKCYPQVDEWCTHYGPLDFIWFDTPDSMPKGHVEERVTLVRRTQPKALLCSRVGHGLGDYTSLGDREVPPLNQPGLWETCDTTNDSWAYSRYDRNWKDAAAIPRKRASSRCASYLRNKIRRRSRRPFKASPRGTIRCVVRRRVRSRSRVCRAETRYTLGRPPASRVR